MDYLHCFLGFQYERFWDVGQDDNSSGDVQNYGGFVGGRFDF
jgi:hypothetical protein